ncbi:MAG: MFS transporter [Nocardioides sp.]
MELHARRQRRLVALVQVLALSSWFSASAVGPSLQSALGISLGAAVVLTSAVQAGFVIGAVSSATLNLADRVEAPRLMAVSALGAAVCTALVAVPGNSFTVVVLLRLLTGVSLAGVYPVGLKVMASWSTTRQRGRAFGMLVGALTLGSAMPQLIRGIEGLAWQGVLLAAASLTLVGAALARTALRTGPHTLARSRDLSPRYALAMFLERGPRAANFGYFGHMWELYALWAWLPAFILASQAANGSSTGGIVNVVAFASIGLAGVTGCLLGGWSSDRLGRVRTAVAALSVSGACCLLSPLFFGAPVPVLTIFLLVWGAAVIADSGVFSTALSESADPRYVGTALTAQTAIGFLLTIVTIHLVPVLAAGVGWRYAFLLLAVGPMLGVAAMSRYRTPSVAGAAS